MENVRTAQAAQAAKALLVSRGFGVLVTLSEQIRGYPFGSVVTYAVDPSGHPIFLLSALAVHTTNLSANPRASLLIYAESAESDPLSSARANFFGTIHEMPEAQTQSARTAYLARHPEAAQWIDFGDFALYSMFLEKAYYVGGFGVMGWVEGPNLQ